jgi:hypothetical protein
MFEDERSVPSVKKIGVAIGIDPGKVARHEGETAKELDVIAGRLGSAYAAE